MGSGRGHPTQAVGMQHPVGTPTIHGVAPMGRRTGAAEAGTSGGPARHGTPDKSLILAVHCKDEKQGLFLDEVNLCTYFLRWSLLLLPLLLLLLLRVSLPSQSY